MGALRLAACHSKMARSSPTSRRCMHSRWPSNPKVRERNLARDPDLLIKVTDMVFEIEKVTERECGEPQGVDLALLLLSRVQEGGNE